MDGAGPSSQGGSILDTSSGSTLAFGRVSVGVGPTPPQSLRVRDVVVAGEVAAINLLEMKAMFLALQSFRRWSPVVV